MPLTRRNGSSFLDKLASPPELGKAAPNCHLHSMDVFASNVLPYKGIVVTVWFALFFLGERLAPAATTARGWFGDWPRLLKNGGLFAINTGLSILIILPATVWAAGFTLGLRPDWWSGWTGFALDLLLLDFWIYWWHRANHNAGLLWRFHEVHHLDRFLDTSSAVRFHFGEVILSACVRAVVIVLWDIPFATVVAFEGLVLIAAIFQHSNLRLPRAFERALSFVIITPSIHWVHHHAVQRDTDSNYGTVLSLWDRAFGSLSPTERTPDMEIGTQGRAERDFPGLLANPVLSRGLG
jgi:sterol desaturase/sphingolipid hydroxylase (fatty acid hydroxylase superfamily)